MRILEFLECHAVQKQRAFQVVPVFCMGQSADSACQGGSARVVDIKSSESSGRASGATACGDRAGCGEAHPAGQPMEC